MQQQQQSVIDEKTALDSNIEHLTEFINGDTFKAFSASDQAGLMDQLKRMVVYSSTLARRISD